MRMRRNSGIYPSLFVLNLTHDNVERFVWRRGAQVAPFGFRFWNPRR